MNPIERQYTPEQLLAAWETARKMHWPDTYAEAMEHPLYSRIVRLSAFHKLVEGVIQRRDVGSAHVEAPPSCYPDGAQPPADERRFAPRGQSFPVTKRDQPSPLPQRRAIDKKSLAAGEKPEPDTLPPVL